MALDISTTDGIIIVTFVRRFDADSAPVVEGELRKVFTGLPQCALFDFTDTEYIASAGLRVLLSTTRTILKANGSVVLCNLSPKVRQVFEIAGFMKIFTVAASREEALSLLKR